MTKRLLCLTFLLGIFLNTYSQEDSLIVYKYGFIYETNVRYSNFSNLNKVLKTNGFDEFNEEYFGFSFGITSRIIDQKTYVSSFLNYIRNESYNQENNKKASVEVVEIAVESHHVISKSPKWYLYPYLGFGLSSSRMQLTETLLNLDFNESISELATNEVNSKNYNLRNPLIFGNIGFGIDRKFKFFGNDFYVGYSLGYKFSTKSDWGYEESPGLNFGGLEHKVKIRIEYNQRYKNVKPKLFEW